MAKRKKITEAIAIGAQFHAIYTRRQSDCRRNS